MARKRTAASSDLSGVAMQQFGRLPRKLQVGLVVVGIATLGIVALAASRRPVESGAYGNGEANTFLFAHWNMENFFDDVDDPKNHDDLEDYFGTHPEAFQLKVAHLTEALLQMNGGFGPDILAGCEIENERCLKALVESLNAALEKKGFADKKYINILFKEDNTGRRFAPGIITRLPVIADRTRKLGKQGNGRILEGHVIVNGHDLAIIAAHWTSRVTDKDGDGTRRLSYAKDCYGRARAILAENADADVIVCGDFNDEFTDASLKEGMFAVNNKDEVLNSTAAPKLFASLTQSEEPPGTIYGKSHWSIFDHVLLARGMLVTAGWEADLKSASIFAPDLLRLSYGKHQPKKFGDAKTKERDRGYSDHFPVTLRLRVQGKPELAPPPTVITPTP